jgi:hypothetical protein
MRVFSLLILLLIPAASFAGFPIEPQVQCTVLSEVNNSKQPDQDISFSLLDLVSCNGKAFAHSVSNTPLTMEVGYAAACQDSPMITYPEHLSGVSISGPEGSGVYARSFSMGIHTEYSLQIQTKVGNKAYNVIAHCKIVR